MSHDDRIRQLTDLLMADLRGPVETSVRQLLDQLLATSAEEHDAKIAEVERRAVADRESAVTAALQAAREEHARALDAAREEHASALGSAREEHGRALEAIRAELGEAHRRAATESLDAASAERADAVQIAEAALRDQLVSNHEAAMNALQANLESDRASFLQERAELEAAVAQLSRERDNARSSVTELTDQLALARAQQEHMTDLAHAESAAVDEGSEAQFVDAHVEERQAELACSERLIVGFRELDQSRSLVDILSALASHAGLEAAHVAVLLVQNGRLRGWRAVGMGAVSASAIDLPIEGSGILGRAVSTAQPASTSDPGEDLTVALPSFLLPTRGRVGLALPLEVGGRVVAVLYADDAGEETRMVPSNWPEAIELLTRHASRCLEVLTFAKAKTVPAQPSHEAAPPAAAAPPGANDDEQEEESARRHARLLISEIKLYNESLVEQGRRDGNLLGLLGPEIERARRLYEEKIPAAVRQRVDCFDQEIVRTLAGGDRTLLGQTT